MIIGEKCTAWQQRIRYFQQKCHIYRTKGKRLWSIWNGIKTKKNCILLYMRIVPECTAHVYILAYARMTFWLILFFSLVFFEIIVARCTPEVEAISFLFLFHSFLALAVSFRIVIFPTKFVFLLLNSMECVKILEPRVLLLSAGPSESSTHLEVKSLSIVNLD